MKIKHNHYPVLFGCFTFMGIMYSVPYFLRISNDNKNSTTKALSGSQRQRGMYLNAGSQDVGPDPDWDFKTSTYKGYKK